MKIFAKVALVLLIIVCGAFTGGAQDKLRRVEQPEKYIYPNTPITVAFTMEGKPIRNGEVEAGPDWLQRVSLEVTNVSRKDISALWINLMLREPVRGLRESTPETTGIFITVELPFSEPRIKVLPAGGRVTLPIPPSMVDHWTEFGRKRGLLEIEKVILQIKRVSFTDNTGWLMGTRTRRDPQSGLNVFVSEDPEQSFIDSLLSVNREKMPLNLCQSFPIAFMK